MPVMSLRGRMMFFAVFTVLALFIAIVDAWLAAQDAEGGSATATVTKVYSQEAYDVSFRTVDGTLCQRSQKWPRQTAEVKTGDSFPVRYSALLPCENFRRADESTAGASVLAWVFPVIGIAGLIWTGANLRRQTRPAGHPSASS
jgi:hypothetical protein